MSLIRLSLILSLILSTSLAGFAQSAKTLNSLREPSKDSAGKGIETNQPFKPAGNLDFAASPFKLNTAKAQIPVQTRLRMIVDSPLSAKYSRLGDEFKAHVLEDFYYMGSYKKLIIPKNSWIRGKVNYLKKPRLLSRSGKLGVKLDSLITPHGEYVPLAADLVFEKGIVNSQGLLDPQTGFKDKAMEPTKNLLDSSAGKAASIATVGIPVAGTLLAGTVIALFSHGDTASVYKGQELQIVVTKDIALDIN